VQRQSSDCNAIVYGSLLRGLHSIDLWPRKRPEDIHISIQELRQKLEALRISTLLGHRDGFGVYTNHSRCSIPNYREEICEVLLSIADPVLDSHRQHMKAPKYGSQRC